MWPFNDFICTCPDCKDFLSDFNNFCDDSDGLSNPAMPAVNSFDSGEKSMVGTQFNTGNSTVRSLPEGTVLGVVGLGRLEIIDIPTVSLGVEDFNEGDRVVTSHGPATVVRLSVRFKGLEGFDPATQILYVADEDSVVRRADVSDVEFEQ